MDNLFQFEQIDKVFNSAGNDVPTSGSHSKENGLSSKQKKVSSFSEGVLLSRCVGSQRPVLYEKVCM